jgi:hypothetical protein
MGVGVAVGVAVAVVVAAELYNFSPSLQNFHYCIDN